MLVLTRKLDEKILIGDNIEISVIKIRNNQIRLGITAPRDVRVLRGELEQTTERVEVDLDLNSDEAKAILAATESAENEPAASTTKPKNASMCRNRVSDFLVGKQGERQQAQHEQAQRQPNRATLQANRSLPPLTVFAGKVNRATGVSTLKRAPLTGFVSAR